MKDESDSIKSFKHDVEVYHETLGELGKAKLSFGGNEWASLHLEDFFAKNNFSEGTTYRLLKAKTASGQCFSLFDCKYMGFYVHIDFVVEGDVGETFKEIAVRYTDISEWFMANQRIGGTVGEAITWSNHAKQIAVHVKTDEENFFLTSDIVGTIEQSGEDHLIHEHVLFSFEKTDGSFVVEDVGKKALELSSLLSILIAYPLSVVSTQVRCDKGRMHNVYFPTYKRIERGRSDGWFVTKCFIQRATIDDRWQVIFQNYYQSEYRKLSWVRLAGMQRYRDFWEYKALGYVSLLDRYVTQRSLDQKASPIAPSSEKLAKLRRAAKKISPQLSDAQCIDLITAADKIFLEKRELYFSEKYEYATKNSDSHVVKIINISADDFTKIKKVRDKIAHGDSVDFIGNDLGPISIIVDKIALLLTYWAFLDFGLTSNDFIGCLTRSHSRLAVNAALDRVHLARVSGSADFFTVSKKEFHTISKTKGLGFAPCFTEGKRGAIRYSKKYSDIYGAWYKNIEARANNKSYNEIFGVAKSRFRYSHAAYMESGDKSFLLNDVCIIKDI